jgi:hypothetical protein
MHRTYLLIVSYMYGRSMLHQVSDDLHVSKVGGIVDREEPFMIFASLINPYLKFHLPLFLFNTFLIQNKTS